MIDTVSPPAKRFNVAAFIRSAIYDIGTSWSVGVSGAIAEFHHCPKEPSKVSHDAMVCRSALGAIRFARPLPEELVVHLCERPNGQFTQILREAVLSLPSAGRQPGAIRELGPDQASLRGDCRHHHVFDLGLAGGSIRSCVRTDDPTVIAALRELTGTPFTNAPPDSVEQLRTSNPHRVFDSPLARIEVYQPIAVKKTPSGPHTHILPTRLGRPCGNEHAVPAGHEVVLSCYPSEEFVAQGHPLPPAPSAYSCLKAKVARSLRQAVAPAKSAQSVDRTFAIAIATAVIEHQDRFGESLVTRAWRNKAKDALAEFT